MTDIQNAITKVDQKACADCPLLKIAEPTDNIIQELVKGIQQANMGLDVLNMAIKERDLEIAKLNNALNRHAISALTHLN